MVGLENLNYEKSRALWKKKCLSSHLQRILEFVLSNAVWTRERKFRHTRGRRSLHRSASSATWRKMKPRNAFFGNARSGKIFAKSSRLPKRSMKTLDIR